LLIGQINFHCQADVCIANCPPGKKNGGCLFESCCHHRNRIIIPDQNGVAYVVLLGELLNVAGPTGLPLYLGLREFCKSSNAWALDQPINHRFLKLGPWPLANFAGLLLPSGGWRDSHFGLRRGELIASYSVRGRGTSGKCLLASLLANSSPLSNPRPILGSLNIFPVP
jgi:hypothetical protein